MASNPPFQVEDTDEDFFDKLVDDDDDVDFKVTASSAARSSSLDSVGQVFGDGNDSDEVKAFANLSINDVSSVSSHQVDGSKKIGVDAIQQNGDVHDNVVGETKGDLKLQGDVKESESVLKSENSFDLGEITKSNKHNNVGIESVSDTKLNTDTGHGATGVKEVQWSVFHEDGTQNDGSGFGSYSDFFSELSEKTDSSEIVPGDFQTDITKTPPSGGGDIIQSSNSVNSNQGFQEDYNYDASVQQIPLEQDQNSIAYWESLYPGWKINPNTGEWYQVDGYEAGQGQGQNQQGNAQAFTSSAWASVGGNNNPEVSYLQQSFQPVSGITEDSGITQNVTTWNQESDPNGATGIASISSQALQGTDNAATLDWNQSSSANNGYPSHMVFDPQYPDWYYDTITQEWKSLESYNLSSNVTVQEQKQNGFSTTDPASSIEYQNAYGQVKNNSVQGFDTQGQNVVWSGSSTNYNPQDLNAWQHETVGKTEPFIDYRQNQQVGSQYGSDSYRNDHSTQQVANDYGRVPSSYEEKHQNQHNFSTFATPQSNVPLGSFSQQYSHHHISEQKPVSNEYYSNQNSSSFPQKQFHGSQQFSYAPVAERSSVGRPPHALITFGFGGKLIVAKDNNTSFGNQNHVGSSISVLNMKDVFVENADNDSGLGSSDYLRTLCLQSFPGPLISGGAGLKELNKWFDERIEKCQFLQQNRDVLRLLLSLLKLSCQYYGKLRSPIGSDNILKESDAPEVAVARLFASAKTNATQFNQYGDITNCLQRLPSEAQMRATAAEVQNLLVSGKKIEALHCAQEGQLWGPAIVLAAQFGNQFYAETVKQMGLRQLVPGSPLRTLCLLIAGQPADVFDIPANSGMFGAMNMNQQPTQFSSNGVVDDWEENLAVIIANRTKDDELVLLNLGDCIWKEKNDVIAAHICYLVAEANFEVYSDTARLCLVGADHWKFPRTYASPEAIQRTEIYEYSKVMGNSQFTLLPFQPYKFVYALMLAEVGRISDSLKYCQLVLKSLKTARAPEAENLRQSVSALEERIKTHQQGGYSTNLAPAKLVGKLLNLFDSTAQRVVGFPPPIPSHSVSNPPINEHHSPAGGGSRVAASQSTMAMSSLMDPTSEWSANNNRMAMHTRSVSEPDFSRSPTQDQVDSSKDASSTNSGGEKSSGGSSRLGRFGFGSGLLQKTVGLVLRPRHGKEAKLGDQNKFYYDEKLKSWVEEGAKPPSEVLAPPPPPTTTPFLNGSIDYNLKAALKSEGSINNGSPELKTPPVDHGSGIPPLPPTSNQYLARGRMGVRSRYVDTFNQSGGNQTNLFQTPSSSISSSSSLQTNNNNNKKASSNPKFFVPAPITSSSPPEEPSSFDNLSDTTKHQISLPNESENTIPNKNTPHVMMMSSTIHRNGSFDSISPNNNTSFSGPARRTASWSGSFGGITNPPFSKDAARPLGEVLGISSSSSPTYNNNNSIPSFPINGAPGFGDELHEVEL